MNSELNEAPTQNLSATTGAKSLTGVLERIVLKSTLSGVFMAAFLLISIAYFSLVIFGERFSTKDNTAKILESIQSAEKKQQEYIEKQRALFLDPPNIIGRGFYVSSGKCFPKISAAALSNNLAITARNEAGSYLTATYVPSNGLPTALLLLCYDDKRGNIISATNFTASGSGIVDALYQEINRK